MTDSSYVAITCLRSLVLVAHSLYNTNKIQTYFIIQKPGWQVNLNRIIFYGWDKQLEIRAVYNTNKTQTSIMKIAVEKGQEKPLLADGQQTVTITHIDEGSSEYKGIPFFAVRFENEDGYVSHRFYQSPAGMPAIVSLFDMVGIPVQEGKDLDTKQLMDKELTIEVGERSYTDPETGNERTLKQAANFLVS